MGARFFNSFSKGRLAWLLGMLLLMPLAQTAASWHLISHVHAQSSEKRDDSSVNLADYCDLCQTAAATMGGVLATQSVAHFAAPAPLETPQFPSRSAVLPQPWQPYASRAPPFALN